MAREQHAAVTPDVAQDEPAGRAVHEALPSTEADRVQRQVRSDLRPREPHLVAGGGEGEALEAGPVGGQWGPHALAVDRHDRSPVVVGDGMLEERDAVQAGRDAQVADAAGHRLEQHVADGVFEPREALDAPHDREGRSIGRPVRLADVLQDLAGPASRLGRAGEHRHGVLARLEERHLGAGDTLHAGLRITERARVGAAHAGGEDLAGAAVPHGGVEHLSVAREAGGIHEPAPERQAMERGRGRRPAGAPSRHEGAGDEQGEDGP